MVKKKDTDKYKDFDSDNKKIKVNAQDNTDQEEKSENPAVEIDMEKDFEKVEEKLTEQEKEIASLKDKYIRLQADFDNYRKRGYKEITGARQSAQLETVLPFLQVFDHFDMALQASNNADNMDAIKEGLKMIFNEFKKALEELGIQRVDAVGQPFDPTIHDAMAHEPSEEHDEGTVCKQWSSAYKIGDKVIRPATVVVSSGTPEANS